MEDAPGSRPERRSERQAPMIDVVDDIIRDLETGVARELATACQRLRAISALQPLAIEASRRYRKAVEAFGEHFPFSDQKVRRLCRANAVGAPTGLGFAQQIEGTWHVIEAKFLDYVERIERGEQVD
jgi:hypothetical protein